jgi:hypothetical protein
MMGETLVAETIQYHSLDKVGWGNKKTLANYKVGLTP